MSEQQQSTPSSEQRLPWWLWLCRKLWKLLAFLAVSVFLAVAVNDLATWSTSSKGQLPKDAPVSQWVSNWPLSVSLEACLLLLAALVWSISRWSVPALQKFVLTTQDRGILLRRLKLRYEQMLAQSLQGAVQLELGLASRPTAIENTASLALRLPEQPAHPLPPHTSIDAVYEQAQHELLILGEPGAGKSTLLVELAQYLISHAEYDEKHPLPVIVPLSSWATTRSPLQEWLVEQFALLYDVPAKLSQQLVQTQSILPLLDGLDEMEEVARPACIKAINSYHHEHLHPLVVCSRTR